LKKPLIWIFSTIGGLLLGLVFYLGYIHLVSWLAYPLGILVVLWVAIIAIASTFYLVINLKDLVVSIFKDDKTRDHRGFKKNL
jgi:hypothetical protein